MKRILSLVLCVIMIAAMLTVPVNAASADVYSEGVVDGYYTWAYDFTKGTVVAHLSPNNGVQSNVKINSIGLNMRGDSYWYTDIELDNLTEKVEITFAANHKYNGAYIITSLGDGEDIEITADDVKHSGDYTVTLTFDPVTGEVYNGTTLKGTIQINSETKVLRFKYTGTGNHGAVKTLTIKQKQGGATLPTPEEVAAAIKVDGYQKSAVVEGVYNVRFAVVINSFFAGQDYVGVEITTTAGGGKSWDDLKTDTVYRSLTANFGTEAVTAEERGGEYITAAAITGVPESEGAIEFVITPYVIIGEDKVYGEAKTVTVDPAAAE